MNIEKYANDIYQAVVSLTGNIEYAQQKYEEVLAKGIIPDNLKEEYKL